MRILVSGATGLVGSHFVRTAVDAGHECVALTRRPQSRDDIGWDPDQRQVDAQQLEGFDAVVHLAGDNIAKGRWTNAKKRTIQESRVQGTDLLCRTLTSVNAKPTVIVSASAIGYYGDRGDESLDEDSPPGTSFLSHVCRDWEAATEPARDAGIRVVSSRIGVVLSTQGGALKQMLTPFRMGVGGVVGSGRQYWSWISIDDVARAILRAVEDQELCGPYNVVSPQPLTNREFTKGLGSVLHRPTIVPMPAMAARLALGEMADELLLASTRVYPKRLSAAGFEFRYPDLHGALTAMIRAR